MSWLQACGLWRPGGHGPNATFFFWGGTSFSSPLTAGVAALMLEKNPGLEQTDVEDIMKSTALPVSADDSRTNVFEPFISSSTLGTPVYTTRHGTQIATTMGTPLLRRSHVIQSAPDCCGPIQR